MIDDHNDSGSMCAFASVFVWNQRWNAQGQNTLLGECRETDNISICAAPISALDLSGLPTTFIDVGPTEMFCDQDVVLAQKLWRDGVQCELSCLVMWISWIS